MKKSIYPKIFMWLFVGLLITFFTGIYVVTNNNMLSTIFEGNFFWILVLLELGLAIFLSIRIHKMQPITAKIVYIAYSVLSGVSFSSVFIVYKLESILFAFLVASVLFLIFAIIGFTTKIDLSKIGTFLFMMLLGIVVCSLINIFIGNTTFDLIISCISIVIFLGYIAYDIQMIQRLEDEFPEENLAIFGAFQLYLDFINIIYDLLNLFGKRDD